MQLLVDQPLYIRKLYKGYGVPEAGPVPVIPANPYTSAYERRNPYPYDPTRAVGLLRAHGWKVIPSGTSVCADGARCGVPTGTKLDLSLSYQSGDQVGDEQVAALASSWEQAGIHVRPQALPLNTLLGEVQRCAGTRCTWELTSLGWTYAPYPSGEPFFETGAAFNLGSYSDATADRLIRQSIDTNAGLTRYENYLAKELPVLWQPYTGSLLEVKKNIHGFSFSPFFTWTPEAWRVK
jgi:peptide/nickel transport system substrate-binding protein